MFVIDFLSPMSFVTGASASGSHAAKIAGLHSGTALHGRWGIGELSNTYFIYHIIQMKLKNMINIYLYSSYIEFYKYSYINLYINKMI